MAQKITKNGYNIFEHVFEGFPELDWHLLNFELFTLNLILNVDNLFFVMERFESSIKQFIFPRGLSQESEFKATYQLLSELLLFGQISNFVRFNDGKDYWI